MNKNEKLRLLQGLLDPDWTKQRSAAPLWMRPLVVDPSHPSTFVVPGDVSPSPSRWLDPNNGTITTGNFARYLIRGEAAYRAMRDAIFTATGPKHFVFLAGWSVNLAFPLSASSTAPMTLGDILADKSRSGVAIRGIFWRQADELASAIKKWGPLAWMTDATLSFPAAPLPLPGAGPAKSILVALMALDRFGITGRSILGMEGQNFAEAKFINSLPTGVAILDKNHPPLAAHHQKLLVVNGDRGMIAFVGGIDVFPDRIWANGINGCASLGAPYQDIHCQIEGPAAREVLNLMLDRWKKSGVSAGADDPLDWALHAHVSRVPGARCSVQIGHTNANPTCAPPKQSAKHVILKAIAQARRHIYVEDQYLVNMEAAAALNKAVKDQGIKHLTILVPHWKISDLPQCTYRRRRFMTKVFERLTPEQASRVGVYALGEVDMPFAYVHSKSWFIDDECAIIGSANCNRRGWESDSESVAAIVEEATTNSAELTFAHRARMDIWAKLLNVDPWQVHDVAASVVYWRQPPVGARITPYNWQTEYDRFDLDDPKSFASPFSEAQYDAMWDLIDPPG